MEKHDLRGVKIESKKVLRLAAIRMIKKGIKKKEIASNLGVNKNTITHWYTSYKTYGGLSMQEGKKEPKSSNMKLLSVKQEKEIQTMIVDKMPDQLKLNYALWTSKGVGRKRVWCLSGNYYNGQLFAFLGL